MMRSVHLFDKQSPVLAGIRQKSGFAYTSA